MNRFSTYTNTGTHTLSQVVFLLLWGVDCVVVHWQEKRMAFSRGMEAQTAWIDKSRAARDKAQAELEV